MELSLITLISRLPVCSSQHLRAERQVTLPHLESQFLRVRPTGTGDSERRQKGTQKKERKEDMKKNMGKEKRGNSLADIGEDASSQLDLHIVL
ncbi:hypothetical protein STEG23_029434 [Scotinomys teguina]